MPEGAWFLSSGWDGKEVDSNSRRCPGEEPKNSSGFGRSCRTGSQGGLSEVRARQGHLPAQRPQSTGLRVLVPTEARTWRRDRRAAGPWSPLMLAEPGFFPQEKAPELEYAGKK